MVFLPAVTASVFVKGAPEVLQTRLATVPPHYASIAQFFMRRGRRGLALAWKDLPATISPAMVGMMRA